MKKCILTLLLTIAGLISSAQETDDGQDLIDTFFNYYKTRGYEMAIRYSWSTNKWIPVNGDAITNIVVQLEKKVSVMGEFIGQELLKSKSVGSRYRMVSYLVYYQRDPIRFTFTLYKNNNGWEISNFEFDTKFEEEVEASMKLKLGN
jgi:hypothetical protein